MHQGSSLQPRGNGQSFLRVARPNLHRPGRKRSTGCAAPRTNPRRNCRKHKRVFSYSLFGRGSTGFDPAVEGAGSIRPHVRQKTPLAKLTPLLLTLGSPGGNGQYHSLDQYIMGASRLGCRWAQPSRCLFELSIRQEASPGLVRAHPRGQSGAHGPTEPVGGKLSIRSKCGPLHRLGCLEPTPR